MMTRLITLKLEGREARCGCGKTRPSTDQDDGSLAFFEYRGEGSRMATDMCKHCHFSIVAHEHEGVKNNVDPRTVIEKGKCEGFEARGSWEYDVFYCGCRGWD